MPRIDKMARPTQGLILDLLRPLGTCRAQSVLQSSTKVGTKLWPGYVALTGR